MDFKLTEREVGRVVEARVRKRLKEHKAEIEKKVGKSFDSYIKSKDFHAEIRKFVESEWYPNISEYKLNKVAEDMILSKLGYKESKKRKR